MKEATQPAYGRKGYADVGQGYKISSDEWWTLDTEKFTFFHEQCCDCGLVHKTHVRLEGTKIHFRHERRGGPPTPEEVDNSDLPNADLTGRRK